MKYKWLHITLNQLIQQESIFGLDPSSEQSKTRGVEPPGLSEAYITKHYISFDCL